MPFEATVGNSGGRLEGPHGDVQRDSYGFLFRDLRFKKWKPPGPESGHWDWIHERSERLYGVRDDENPDIPAAYTFLGQFMTHDLTFDVRPFLGGGEAPRKLRNWRTPAFDLDCVYGRGPVASPFLYESASRDLASGRIELLVGQNENEEPDLPRSPDCSRDEYTSTDFNRYRTALIGDPRNDENIILSQLHLAFLRFHNAQISKGLDFEAARQQTRWHYQWVIFQDLLPRLCGRARVMELLARVRRGRELDLFRPRARRVFMPVEFSFAALRMGHSMIGDTYHLNDALDGPSDENRGGPGDGAFAMFDPMSPRWGLDGQRRLPPRWTVQWDRFVHVEGGSPVQPSRRIGPKLARALRTLELPVLARRNRSLAYRTLIRGYQVGLPSGEAVARHLGEQPLEGEERPLWLYVLEEAAAPPRHGRTLGPVGARILAEVCVGLLAADPTSLCSAKGREFTHRCGSDPYELKHFLEDAGMPMTRAQWGPVP